MRSQMSLFLSGLVQELECVSADGRQAAVAGGTVVVFGDYQRVVDKAGKWFEEARFVAGNALVDVLGCLKGPPG